MFYHERALNQRARKEHKLELSLIVEANSPLYRRVLENVGECASNVDRELHAAEIARTVAMFRAAKK